jgi:hypothetical protein
MSQSGRIGKGKGPGSEQSSPPNKTLMKRPTGGLMFDPLTLLEDARQIGRRRFRQVRMSFSIEAHLHRRRQLKTSLQAPEGQGAGGRVKPCNRDP